MIRIKRCPVAGCSRREIHLHRREVEAGHAGLPALEAAGEHLAAAPRATPTSTGSQAQTDR